MCPMIEVFVAATMNDHRKSQAVVRPSWGTMGHGVPG